MPTPHARLKAQISGKLGIPIHHRPPVFLSEGNFEEDNEWLQNHLGLGPTVLRDAHLPMCYLAGSFLGTRAEMDALLNTDLMGHLPKGIRSIAKADIEEIQGGYLGSAMFWGGVKSTHELVSWWRGRL
mmetsp:Transcript_26913/g.86454  ORF Transcript_26913/g.86454 Transcript_26913/m.86454 type:complete len:128 (-) Transcript_26913:489-872(-)